MQIILYVSFLNLYSQNNTNNISGLKGEDIKVFSGTFLGNSERNFYGDKAPCRLDVKWKRSLGSGITYVYSKNDTIPWSGAGWTGQPLIVAENGNPFIIQGAYDHKLKKINAQNGNIVWEYKFDDIIKGTGTIWENKRAEDLSGRFVILQGSRLGNNNTLYSNIVPSYRAISYVTGKELWRMNVQQTESYSRDVDGSAIIIKDTAYIGLENGLFVAFNPDPAVAVVSGGIKQPDIYFRLPLYEQSDALDHKGNIVTESSPCLLRDHLYITSGSGHVYGYNLFTKKIDWDFYIGSDMDGSPVVTYDSCLLVSIEKQYITGRGGVLKLNPAKKPEDAVVWYFPTGDRAYASWLGGVIGSPAVNDFYRKNNEPALAAFLAIDGKLYVVEHDKTDSTRKVTGFDGISTFYPPRLVYEYNTGPSISTPVFINNRLIAAGYNGIYIYEFNSNKKFYLMDKRNISVEATPVCYNGNIFVASRNGYLYCMGDKRNIDRLTAGNLRSSLLLSKLPIVP